MAKIKVKIKEENKGELSPALEKKLVQRSVNLMNLLDKKYRTQLDNQIKGKWQK
jgi:hypothetical protein